MMEFVIENNYITIAQFLKVNGLIASGGEAKYFLKNHQVLVNGIITNKRGHKLYKNDLVEILNERYKLV